MVGKGKKKEDNHCWVLTVHHSLCLMPYRWDFHVLFQGSETQDRLVRSLGMLFCSSNMHLVQTPGIISLPTMGLYI